MDTSNPPEKSEEPSKKAIDFAIPELEEQESQNFVENCGCQLNELEKISNAEAREKILRGEKLQAVEIDHLDLSGLEIKHIIDIENCRIRNFDIFNSTVLDAVFVKKTTITGETVLSNRDEKETFRETRFSNHVRIENVMFIGEFTCIKATFHKELSCCAVFCEKSVFDHSIFEDDIQFNLSVFRENCSIANCRFQGMAWMRGLRFHKQADFRKAFFEKKINIKFSRFYGHTLFTDCDFQMRAGFNRIECKDKLEFDRSNFEDDFSSIASEFNVLSFRNCYAKAQILIPNSTAHKVYFNKMQSQGDLIASKVDFQSRVFMDKIRITGEVNMHKSVFHGAVLCRDSVIGSEEGHINFSNTEFHKELEFENSVFRSTMTFQRAKFFAKTSFRETTLGISSGTVNFEEAQFCHRTNFDKALFAAHTVFNKSIFQKRISFERAVFNYLTSFAHSQFKDVVSFRDVQFLKQCFFQGCQFSEAKFMDTQFEGSVCFALEKYISPDDPQSSVFNNEANFINARFNKKAILQKVKFKDNAFFNNAYFGEQASFQRAEFYKDAVFSGTFCSLELDLRGIQVKEELLLKGSNINRRLNLADAEFSRIAFYNMVSDTMIVTPQQIAGKLRGDYVHQHQDLYRTAQEYLVLKKSFSFLGMQEEEDWAYWQFRRSSRKAETVKAKQNGKIFPVIKSGFEKVFLDYGSSYGTHPLRITILALFMIIAFGIFYSFFPDQIILEGREIAEQSPKPTLMQCIYFSTMAFTTMGFGDVHPDFYGWMKVVVALEALLGIITMTLFVGTYARKIIR